jgi:hypothetical protein
MCEYSPQCLNRDVSIAVRKLPLFTTKTRMPTHLFPSHTINETILLPQSENAQLIESNVDQTSLRVCVRVTYHHSVVSHTDHLSLPQHPQFHRTRTRSHKHPHNAHQQLQKWSASPFPGTWPEVLPISTSRNAPSSIVTTMVIRQTG